MSGEPHPKSVQLARGERRYRRKVASPKQWQAIIAAKRGPCLVCDDERKPVEFHHVLPRDQGGDDVADNIVPLCRDCHRFVTVHDQNAVRDLINSLTDAEYAYAVEKGGEQVFERVYGITYTR